MKEPLLVISPAAPPEPGGVADHTGHLLHHLARSSSIAPQLLSKSGRTSIMGVQTVAYSESWTDASALTRAIEQTGVKHLLWQYVPHLYGRGGVNLALPKVMRALQQKGFRQLVIAHEIAAPHSFWPQRFYYSAAHRLQWREISAVADHLFISTEAWLKKWGGSSGHKTSLLPSPSNIPVTALRPGECEEFRRSLGSPSKLLLSFGAVDQPAFLRESLEACADTSTVLATIGNQNIGTHPRMRHLGMLPAAEVSLPLQSCDALLLPYADGVSERRTSFMAGLAHGCQVLTTIGASTGPSLRAADCFSSTPSDALGAFAQKASELPTVARRVEAAAQAYAERYDWPMVLAQIESVLASHS